MSQNSETKGTSKDAYTEPTSLHAALIRKGQGSAYYPMANAAYTLQHMSSTTDKDKNKVEASRRRTALRAQKEGVSMEV